MRTSEASKTGREWQFYGWWALFAHHSFLALEAIIKEKEMADHRERSSHNLGKGSSHNTSHVSQQEPFLPTDNKGGAARSRLGRVQAASSRIPAKTSAQRKARLKKGKQAAKSLIQGAREKSSHNL